VGYAIPGTVLAVGVFIPAAWLNTKFIEWFSLESASFFEGSVGVLVFALACRFLSVAISPLDSSFQRISPSVILAARSLGGSSLNLLRRIYLPLLRGGFITAFLLVFIDVMKEMPITLMMRPFGWDTLSVRVFEMTSEGEWERAALPAVMLVIVGLLPVILLIRNQDQLQPGDVHE
jgi:iron(III) transport system permease protein